MPKLDADTGPRDTDTDAIGLAMLACLTATPKSLDTVAAECGTDIVTGRHSLAKAAYELSVKIVIVGKGDSARVNLDPKTAEASIRTIAEIWSGDEE